MIFSTKSLSAYGSLEDNKFPIKSLLESALLDKFFLTWSGWNELEEKGHNIVTIKERAAFLVATSKQLWTKQREAKQWKFCIRSAHANGVFEEDSHVKDEQNTATDGDYTFKSNYAPIPVQP